MCVWWCACAVRGVGGVVRCRAVLVRCWCQFAGAGACAGACACAGAGAGAGAGAWLAVLLCPPPDESRQVRVSVTCSPDCHSLMAVWAVANPLGLRLPPPPPSFMSARLLACLLACLHARLPVRMLTAHMHAPTPALACMQPRSCSHARTHAFARMRVPTLTCARARACARSPYLHTPPLIRMHTHTLAR